MCAPPIRPSRSDRRAPSESYLRIDRLIEPARETGAQAIHPGYGFLAERAAFAEAVEEAGLVFIGPPATAIRAMGDKTEARRRMRAAGVPVVPGADAPVTELAAGLMLGRGNGLSGDGEGGRGGRWEGHARREGAGGTGRCTGDRGLRGAQGVRRRQRVPREVHRAPAPRGDPDPGRREPHRTPRRAGMLGAAPPSEGPGGGALGGGGRRPSRADGRRGGRRGDGGRLPQRGHLRVPARRRRRFLLPGNEHPHPGGASRDRAGVRRRPGTASSCASRAAFRCRCPTDR